MSANGTIDFWFTVGSTYTYLTVSRLNEIETASGIRFRWRPFARAIMQEMNNVPFATEPIKLAYMWRDVERRASKYGLPLRVPAPYPLKNFDLASRVAVLGGLGGMVPKLHAS
jgi:2-hydroxychromene-2-carboxylate isomerase